jgi:DNA-binding GntR family transcriptional regulator
MVTKLVPGATAACGGLTRAWAEHADITRSILAGDADAAGTAAYAHAENAGRETEHRLRDEAPSG